MSKRQTPFECECGSSTTVIYKKPDHFTPTVGTFNCSGCDSRYQFQVIKHKPDPTKIELHTKIIGVSDTLRLLRMEAQAESQESP